VHIEQACRKKRIEEGLTSKPELEIEANGEILTLNLLSNGSPERRGTQGKIWGEKGGTVGCVRATTEKGGGKKSPHFFRRYLIQKGTSHWRVARRGGGKEVKWEDKRST